MRTRRLLTSLASGLAATMIVAAPAAAQTSEENGGGYGWVDPGEDGAIVGAEDGQTTEGGGATGGGTFNCVWEPVPAEYWERELGPVAGDGTELDWYFRDCTFADGSTTRDLVGVPRNDPPPPDLDVLRERAVAQLQLPSPSLELNPPGDQVVHVASWLSIDQAVWREHSESVSAGGVTATVTAAPRRTVWDLGNGDSVTCDGPGTPYDPVRPAAEQTTDCSYEYAHSSEGRSGDAYVVTVTIEWDLAWTVTGAPGGGALPPLSTSAAAPVRVAEMQALNQ